MKLDAKQGELVQLMQKFVPRSDVGIFRNEHTHPLHWTLKSCFGAFHSVWQHLGSFRNCMKLVAKWGQLVQLMHKFVPRSHVGIFRNERTQSSHWTLNSCFGVLHSVWVHLGSFPNCMKLGAKRGQLVQLMQKFVAGSHVGIFLNERTQSALLEPKPMFW
jgi:hypothetical protein